MPVLQGAVEKLRWDSDNPSQPDIPKYLKMTKYQYICIYRHTCKESEILFVQQYYYVNEKL